MLPSSRALVGALLLALSGLATFAAWQAAAGDPGVPYVVAARSLRPGATVGVDDVRLVRLDLPPAMAAQAFPSVDAVVGRSTFGPIGAGELVQAAQLSDVGAGSSRVEVAFSLPRDRLLDGKLRPGDRVDVFATDERATSLVAAGAEVLALDGGGDGFSADPELVITLGVRNPADRVPLIHAARQAEVTMTRAIPRGEGG
ncbi:MAG TPA: SAF domain-containing protein [Acidimicrobiales bacterium]